MDCGDSMKKIVTATAAIVGLCVASYIMLKYMIPEPDQCIDSYDGKGPEVKG